MRHNAHHLVFALRTSYGSFLTHFQKFQLPPTSNQDFFPSTRTHPPSLSGLVASRKKTLQLPLSPVPSVSCYSRYFPTSGKLSPPPEGVREGIGRFRGDRKVATSTGQYDIIHQIYPAPLPLCRRPRSPSEFGLWLGHVLFIYVPINQQRSPRFCRF